MSILVIIEHKFKFSKNSTIHIGYVILSVTSGIKYTFMVLNLRDIFCFRLYNLFNL